MAYTKEEITEILLDAVGKAIKRDPATLTPDLKWDDDLHFKSVNGMKVCGLLNYKLKITVPLTMLIECDTLQDAVDKLSEMVQ
ncbi:acyl carrier protein [Adlercreutzia sp. ZJ473]|uniref:acyl carrier protein n=1 Tax=Adlercreutzia sp. ZJ473 TaxID=2722822 RepID=UPI00155164BA|nr:acyl carrier protein [Adlercreutzia sp. ZJ473]